MPATRIGQGEWAARIRGMNRKAQIGAPASMIVLAFIAAACTVIGGERVAGWPQLRIVEHQVPHNEMRERCAKYVGFGLSPEACAEFQFEKRRCDIWYSADFPPQSFIIEHERQHCLGYEHAGEHDLSGFLREYRAQQDRSGAD